MEKLKNARREQDVRPHLPSEIASMTGRVFNVAVVIGGSDTSLIWWRGREKVSHPDADHHVLGLQGDDASEDDDSYLAGAAPQGQRREMVSQLQDFTVCDVSTANRLLEEAGWDLQAAAEAFMVCTPPSCVLAGRIPDPSEQRQGHEEGGGHQAAARARHAAVAPSSSSSDTGSDDEEGKVMRGVQAEMQAMAQAFVEFTGSSKEEATRHLETNGWRLDDAIIQFTVPPKHPSGLMVGGWCGSSRIRFHLQFFISLCPPQPLSSCFSLSVPSFLSISVSGSVLLPLSLTLPLFDSGPNALLFPPSRPLLAHSSPTPLPVLP